LNNNHVIVTFSHLRWDFVYQRPQHLLSRLASNHNHRVIFIEEPVPDPSGVLFWERSTPVPNVLVCRPHTPGESKGFSGDQLPHLKRLVAELVEEEDLHDYLLWFYTAMALPLADGLKPQVIVYDSMDELSAFLGAPPELLEREEELFRRADIVFTGGPSLYRAKKDRHSNVHCFPSSVDTAHFSRARTELPEPADQSGIPHPRLGFFGVIDERLDRDLVGAVAAAHPEWHLVMLGPVVKIDEASLPRPSNIHYLGQKSYKQLPEYLAGWDVCLMPFARNEATRFISPTKTLEYMAAEKMIVSTPITDVAEPYGKIVYLGGTPEEFIAACEQVLEASESERAETVAGMRGVLSRTSWDATAAGMDEMIREVLEARSAKPAVGRRAKRPIVVAGAGPTGLSAAYHLGADAVLLEKENRVGGWCRSIEQDGFTFDFAGHIMFSNEEYVHQLYDMLLGENVHWQDREAWIFSKGVYTRYPFQGALYGLPPDVIKECITGAIEARFGSLKQKREATKANGKANGHANGKANGSSSACVPGDVKDCCADGILEAEVRLGEAAAAAKAQEGPRNFEEFIYKVWGAGIAKHFAIPYNKKLWAVPLSEMETSWLGGRVPLPDLEEMIEGALKPVAKPMGPNARFGYPLRGGFQALMDGFLPRLQGELRLNTRVVGVSPRRRTVRLDDGSDLPYEYLVSTMPLPVLIGMMGSEAPAAVRAAVACLRYVSVRCVNIGVNRPHLTEKHWIYYPEDSVFHRIFVQGNASPHCNPPGGFGLTCEITYSEHKPLPAQGDGLIARCIEDCRRVGIFGREDSVLTAGQVDMPHAYVVYDHARRRNVETIREWVSKQGIILAGRYSEWEYYNSDHAFIAGKRAAEQVRTLEAEQKLNSTLGELGAALLEASAE
jgi:UDP-galactopyranose mutase